MFCRAGHHPEALSDERAVEALQARDIGDGAERDEIEQVDDLRLGKRLEEAAAAQLAQQRNAEQERHADRGEVPVRGAVRALIEPVRIDQRDGDGEQAGALVVVDDDHVEPGSARLLQRLERLRAAVDADRDARALAFSSTSALPDGP